MDNLYKIECVDMFSADRLYSFLKEKTVPAIKAGTAVITNHSFNEKEYDRVWSYIANATSDLNEGDISLWYKLEEKLQLAN